MYGEYQIPQSSLFEEMNYAITNDALSELDE